MEASIENEIPDDLSEGIEIQFWHPWSGEAAGAVDGLVANFNETNPWGIMVFTSSKANTDFLVESVVGIKEREELPALIAAPGAFLRAWYEENGGQIDLEAYIKHPQWGLTEEEILSFPLIFWNQDVDVEGRFGVPAERSINVIFYNQTWAQELGFATPPITPDDFLNQACAAARGNAFDDNFENNGTGGWIFNTEPMTVLSWLRVFGGGELPKEEGQNYLFLNDNNEDAFEFLHTIYHIDCAWIGRKSTPYSYFAKRQALFFSGDSRDILIQEQMDEIEGNQDEWTMLPYPSISEKPTILVESLSYGVFPSDAEHQLAAWLFIRWMLSSQNQAVLIRTTGTLPITITALDELVDFRKGHSSWDEALQFIPLAQPEPVLFSWQVVGHILQDASWQLKQFNVYLEGIPDILAQIESTAREVLSE